MLSDSDYDAGRVLYDFLLDQYNAHMAPEEGQQTYSQPILHTFENNASMVPPKSPALASLSESTDFRPPLSALQMEHGYPPPVSKRAFLHSELSADNPIVDLSALWDSRSSSVSEYSFGSSTPPSSLVIDVPSLPTPAEPWVDEWASLETTVLCLGRQSSALWMLPESDSLFGSSTPPSPLSIDVPSLPGHQSRG